MKSHENTSSLSLIDSFRLYRARERRGVQTESVGPGSIGWPVHARPPCFDTSYVSPVAYDYARSVQSEAMKQSACRFRLVCDEMNTDLITNSQLDESLSESRQLALLSLFREGGGSFGWSALFI